MITVGPMLLVAAGVWWCVMFTRLRAALRDETAWQAGFYRMHLAPIAGLMAGVALSIGWIICCRVGMSLMHYLAIPLLLFYTSCLFNTPAFTQPRMLLQGLALGAACATPAFYYSFTLSWAHMITTGPVWYLGILFYLLLRERHRLCRDNGNAREVVINTIILIALLSVALVSGVTAPLFERTLCITIAIGAGCLQGFSRLSALTTPQNALAFSWPCIALPALLGIYLYAPHSW